jgi:hypothetical protein
MRHIAWIAALMMAGTAGVSDAAAQVQAGPQLSLGTDSGLGVGGRLVFPLRTGALGLDGAIDGNYFFGGGEGVDSWIDGNVNVRLPIPLARDFTTRIGGGINATFLSFDTSGPTTASDSEFGLNLLASIGKPEGRLGPFVEARIVFGGAEQLVVTGGFTFGGNR